MADKETNTLDYLRKLCSVREYCRKDIYDKALKRLEDADKAQQAVDTLMEEGFLSEERYARAYAADKSAIAGWGPSKIRYMLAGKGVDRQAIESALQGMDSQKADLKMRKVMEAKYKTIKEDPQARIKLMKFALSRGYSYDKVKEITDSLFL